MKLFVTVFFLLGAYVLFAQKFVADTIVVGFGKPTPISNGNFRLLDAKDFRADFPQFISVYERKKFLFFPVDQIVKTRLPLAQELCLKFNPATVGGSTYLPKIFNFNAVNAKKGSKRTFSLYSTIELSEQKPNGNTVLVGTFYGKREFIQRKKDSISLGYECLIEDWAKHFSSDITAIQQNLDKAMPNDFYYFRRGKEAVPRNFYSSVDFFYGLNFWGIDGELWFSEPESNRKFNRTSRMIRYQNHPKFQSIAIGNKINQWNYRKNEKWLFSNKTAFLIGFNNWKDMKTASHTFEEIFLFNLSATQKITFNPFDKKGLTGGIGIMENAHYIIYHQPELKVALVLNIALKF